jgi:hypothetical protein
MHITLHLRASTAASTLYFWFSFGPLRVTFTFYEHELLTRHFLGETGLLWSSLFLTYEELPRPLFVPVFMMHIYTHTDIWSKQFGPLVFLKIGN